MNGIPSLDRPTRVRYLVLAWLCAAAAIAYVQRSCISVPSKSIRAELDITPAQMAWVMSAFLVGYAGFQLPSGWLGDRWGTRRALTLYWVLWSAATGWMGLATGFVSLFSSRLAIGTAQAGIFPCCVGTIAKWFPQSQRAFPNGLLGSFMSVGAALASALTGFLLVYLSWQAVFWWFAVPGILTAVGFYLWFRDRPREHPWVNEAEARLIEGNAPLAAEAPAGAPQTSPWGTILTSPRMGLICAQQFFRAAGYFFYLSWFPEFLQQTRGTTEVEAGFLTSLPLMGVVLGSTASGVGMDWVWRRTGSHRLSRQGIAVISMLACTLFLVAAYFVPDPLPAVAVISLSAFCAGTAGPAGYTVTIDLGGRHVATVFSTMNMAGNIGAFFTPIVVERLASWHSWEVILLFLAGLYLAAAACWALLNVEGSLFPDDDRAEADTRITATIEKQPED